MAAGDIAVNNSPGKLRCNAVIFAVCCNWNMDVAKQVKYLLIVSQKSSSFTSSHELYRIILALQYEQAATEKAHAQLRLRRKRRAGKMENDHKITQTMWRVSTDGDFSCL